MLRKRLLARLGLLVLGFVTGAVVSLALLQGVLRDLDAINGEGEATIPVVRELSATVSDLESDYLTALVDQRTVTGALAAKATMLPAILDTLGDHRLVKTPGGDAAASYQRIRSVADSMFSGGRVVEGAPLPGAEFRAALAQLRSETARLSTASESRLVGEQTKLSWHLRSLIIGLTVAAIMMTNIAIFVLVWTANMILRPVGELIQGSRELAQEHFDYRVRVTQTGEFAELASAYNTLAGQLAQNEQRKVKALQQLAVTLNHELNNVINIIELQLKVVDKRTGRDPKLATYLSDIHQNLGRMANTIASLRNVRRVVLTEYLPGEPMLDLPRSIATEDAPAAQPVPTPEPSSATNSINRSPA